MAKLNAVESNAVLLSEACGDTLPVSLPPIWQRLHASAAAYPNKLAVACLHQQTNLHGLESLANDHLELSYAQLYSAAQALGASLRARGIRVGSPMMTILGNGVEFCLSVWTAHALGCPIVPINPKNLQNKSEVRHMLAVAGITTVIVDSSESAASFDVLAVDTDRTLLKVSAGASVANDWIPFSHMLGSEQRGGAKPGAETDVPVPELFGEDETNERVAVLFTSGTTSLPKGCPHSNKTLNTFLYMLGDASSEDIFCAVLPNNHAMGYFFALQHFCNGGAVVYPSSTFHPQQMMIAIEIYGCTHTCLVPTALHSLLRYARRNGLAPPTLKDITLAGASISPDDLRQSIYTLDSKAISTGLGLTEGSPIWVVGVEDPETLISGDQIFSGRASPGASLKICLPGSIHPLPRGQLGEVHECGPGVIPYYLGDHVGTESFYKENGKCWFKTGDQGIMEHDGRVSIVGRYKDMIIRGGENLAPAAIESVLNRFPGVEAQVVAAADTIAGELPVAVLRELPAGDHPSESLLDAVRKALGVLYVPDEILTLETIGLDDYPRTMSGKVKKSTLRDLVALYRRGADGFQKDSEPNSLEHKILRIWGRATGIPPGSLDTMASTSHFADSITTMRVRDMYKKQLGYSLSVGEMAENDSIRRQIHELQRRRYGNEIQEHRLRQPPVSQHVGLEDIQLAIDSASDPEVFKASANAVLEPYGLSFDHDVASVIRTTDIFDVLIQSKVIDSWNFSTAIVADKTTIPALEKALIAALERNTLLPSYYLLAEDGTPCYLTIKPQTKLYDHCLTICGSLPTLADLKQLALRYPHPEHATHLGPLFHAQLYYVEEISSAALVTRLHHAVHDASAMRLFFEDLDQSLRDPEGVLKPHVPYETWADLYHSLRHSPRASLDVNWHVNRLRDVHIHRKALYPPAVSPRQSMSAALDTDHSGIEHLFDVPELLTLKKQHSIAASVVFKAAIALVNVARTQHTHALFANLEAARFDLPFSPRVPGRSNRGLSTSDKDVDAADVAGPTMNAAVNLIEVPRSQNALSFLEDLQIEQTELTRRCHVPWRRIISQLDSLHPSERAGEMLIDTLDAQLFTWVPGMMGEYEKIRFEKFGGGAAVGLVIGAGILGTMGTTYFLNLGWDVANVSREDAERFVQDVETAVRWLLNEQNWEEPVVGVLESLSS